MAWEPNNEIHEAIEEARIARERLYKAIDKLETQNADLVAALEAVDKILSSQQGLDYTYWSQAEKDIHELAKQALAQVKEE